MKGSLRLTLLATWALALSACGIDAIGAMTATDGTDSAPPPRADDAGAPPMDGGADDGGATLPDAGTDAADAALVPDAAVGPLLELSHAPAPATADLTAEGAIDWAYWGANGNTTSIRKVGTSLISARTYVFSSSGSSSSGFGTTFSWTDSTSGSGSSDGYVYVVGAVGEARHSVSYPSGPVKRTLVVFVGGSEIRGKFTASLADGSLAPKTDATYESQDDTFGVKYTVEFRTVAPSTLTVEWRIDAGYGTNSARFTAVAIR